MLKILHKGIQASLNLDTSDFTGVLATDLALAYVQGLTGGRLVALDSDGVAQLADGVAANDLEPVGFLINDAGGYFFENKPALASQKVAVTFGNCVIVTDQIDTDLTFVPGEKLYAGTGDNIGLITNVAGAGASVIGIAGSEASAAAPELTIFVK